MHKKLFTAVLALGLLLPSFALALPEAPSDGAGRPVQTWGSGQSKTGVPVLGASIADPLVTVNAGTNRTVPGTFCDGQYQGALTYGISNWYFADEFYAGYQDPQDPTRFGSVCSNSPSFDVTAINTILGVTTAPFPFTFVMQPLVFDVASPSATAPCTQEPAPIAGGASCVGPVYAITWNAAGFFSINLPFSLECCQTDAYYAAWYSPTNGNGRIRIGTDGGAHGGANYCSQWNEYGAGWKDMDQFWEANFGPGLDLTHLTWSEGYTPDDPATHCNAGTCAYDFAYTTADSSHVRFEDGNDDWFTGFVLPNFAANGASKWGVRFDAIGLDTLKEFKVLMYEGFAGAGGPDDLLIEVWSQGPATGCGGEKVPGSVIYSVAVPSGSVSYYPNMTTVPMPDITFGTLNGGPETSIFVTVTTTNGGRTGATMGYPTSTSGCLTTPFRPHSLLYYPNWQLLGSPQWKYTGERSTLAVVGHFEFWIDGLICREILPATEDPCLVVGNDQWQSFAHDNRQSSASSLDIGNPNQVTLAWTRALPRISNFTNPSVSGNIVYQSTDQEVNAYNLLTGAPVGTFFGAPEIGSSNRGNTTVATVAALGRSVVFATGGNFNGITALETNLETSPMIWSNNVLNFNPPNGMGVGQQNRFNSSKVVSISGTDVLFVTTEPAAGTGRIFAFNAATGALYPGWGVNPLTLDAAAKHGPAVNGGKLYVGTAIGGSNVDGSLYRIDAATGTIDWIYAGVGDPTEGWPSGVSTEGNFVYGATRDAANVGVRYKIDVSGLTPSLVWSSTQGVGLYGTPTIGRSFVYFPLDNPSFGLLQIDKSLGLVARNFAAENICGVSPFMIPQIVTLSCDGYLFAGDRNARWWLINAVSGELEWYRQWPLVTGGEIVSGTALATYTISGDDYAVVANRQLNGTVGQLSSYKLNAGPRSRLIQCVTDVTIEVPFGTGPGTPHSEADALLNVGETPLTFSSVSISDPAPDGLAAASRRLRMANVAAREVGLQYRTIDGTYDMENGRKALERVGLAGMATVDGEWSTRRYSTMNSIESNYIAVGRNASNRASAASASTMRTSNVQIDGASIPTSIAPGVSATLSWDYDGTGLGRGQDLNVIELENNDPDFDYDAVNHGGLSIAEVNVLYVGGCAPGNVDLTWAGGANHEKVFNHGAFGDQAADALVIGSDPTGGFNTNLFDGGVLVTGDSSGAIGGAQLAVDYYEFAEYLPNPLPSGGCGFERDSNLVLGAKRTGGCPGTPVDITGAYVKTYYADSNLNVAGGTPLSAIGVNVEQTEVGANDPLYGDFKLTRYKVVNRDAVAKTVRAGSYLDWDIGVGSAINNVGIVSDAFNGYVLWNFTAPGYGYGIIDANQPSTYSGVDPSVNPPAFIMANLNDTTYTAAPGDWIGDTYPDDWGYGWYLANGHYSGPRAVMGGSGIAGTNADRGGFQVNELSLSPNGSGEVVQATFYVPAVNNDATMIASSAGVAKRVARWAGFARGDVNDDGIVDLADVCWLQGGNPIYPAAYSGDVDANGSNDGADVSRLLSFVSGNAGDRPAGAWRFPW